MTQAISEYTRRPLRAAELDGLNDVHAGIVFLAITLMESTSTLFQGTLRGSNFAGTFAFRATLALWVATTVAMFVVIILSKRGIASLRERYVYPRLGYVAPRVAPERRRKLLTSVAALGAVALTGVFALVLPMTYLSLGIWNTGAMVTLLGIIGAVSCCIHFAKLGFTRHLVLGVVALAAALLLATLHLDDLPAIYCWTVILGLCGMVGGGLAFARLLKAPVLTGEAGE